MVTDQLFLRDAYLRSFDATVRAVEDDRVALDRTAFYPTSGGQPHDTGVLRWDGGEAAVTAVRKDGDVLWHTLDGPVPEAGTTVEGELDWELRHQLMRTHTALHVLCGVIWNEYGTSVTGGNMEPLSARMDFEFDPLPEGFKQTIEDRVNAELAADHSIEVSFLPRSEALADDALIRTNVGLRKLTEDQDVRIVEIVGLDRQADGGTHVRSTAEVGRIRIVKTESKGKGNKRVRLEILDVAGP